MSFTNTTSTKGSGGTLSNSTYLVPPDLEEFSGSYTVNSSVPRAPKYHLDYLEASEHRATAANVDLFDVRGQKLDHDEILVTVKARGGEVKLSFGQIIALAGDFYTCREGRGVYFPICDSDDFGTSLLNKKSTKTAGQRFDCAVESLLRDQDGYLKKVQDLLDQEHEAVDQARAAGDSVAQTYHTGSHQFHCHIPTDREFFEATKDWLQAPLLAAYVWIAYTNIDHFGEDAVTAYCVGHTRALQIAREARKEPSIEKRMVKLRLAYIYEAFAAHYLTDLFSSGHVRSPRRQMHSTSWTQTAAAGLAGTPIWDMQSRYMHDDDSATGIMVCNAKGDQWIEYGDKQFFEPQAIVNRARCMECLRVSAREVYEVGFGKGFESNRVIIDEDWSANKTWFAAMNLIPKPMTAIADSSWLHDYGGYDMHNPAPLWLSPIVNGPDVKEGWTIRKDINDHSNFSQRVRGSLRSVSAIPKATEECEAIKNANFRARDQFPLQLEIKGLLSGGLIQIQDLNASQPGKGTCINFWGPVRVDILNKTYHTWTLRNRLIDQDVSPNPQGHVLHWMRGDEPLSIVGFSWVEASDGACDIVSKMTRYRSRWADVPSDGGPVILDFNKTWAVEELMYTEPIKILGNLPDRRSLNMTRFSKGFFLSQPESKYDAMDLLALTQVKGKGVKIGLLATSSDNRNICFHLDDLKEGEAYGFVKRFRGAGSNTDSILLARRTTKSASSTLDLVQVIFDAFNQPRLQQSSFEPNGESVTESASVLVGDVLGLGHDHIVVIDFSTHAAHINVYGNKNTKESIVSLGSGSLPASHDHTLEYPILTALVPTTTSLRGLDILEISRRRKNSSSDLVFRTYLRADSSSPGDGPLPFSDPKECVVEDPLVSSSPEHFFSIKWMPVRYQADSEVERRGLLEIFSWYGVMGTRLFGPSAKGWDYSLLGQLPYLGQTSIGAGLGSHGDWGHGFIAWSKESEWIDVNMFTRSEKSGPTGGSWGMEWEDLERRQIRGWDVESRPLKY
ncbi:hypothetical protein CSUB01_12117 [Colletotrichum sublineola]|uniref:Uncharacterized protein n=1 Tax=Colletotrichum sublineola TaxID=1173701 RepID=A0A066Y028_COLSU|nr:hypothetical protein CSUB01_12117 [Colletotrichum sublineola]